MDAVRNYGSLIVALVAGPIIVYAISYFTFASSHVNTNPMEDQGQPLILGKSLSKKDKFLMDLLNSPEHMNDCWVVTDPAQADNPIIFASPGFCTMTGYQFDEIVGRNCRFLQGEGTDRGEVSKIRNATEHEGEAEVRVLNYRKDGTPFNNEFFITPLHSEDGSLSYHLGVQSTGAA